MNLLSSLSKIKNIKSFVDFKSKVCGKVKVIRRELSFVIHDWVVSLFHGKHRKQIFDFHISHEDVNQLMKRLESSKELKNSHNHQIKEKRGNQKPDQEFYEQMNSSTTWFEIKKNDTDDVFLKKLEPIFKDYLQSPFTIVNVSAWMTNPKIPLIYGSDGEQRGPYRLHRDGYPPGHFKCMVYLKPLIETYGKVQVEEKKFESKKPGFAVLFNTEMLHHGIPGTSEIRYSIEITLMRTLIEVDILKHYPSTPDSKYFYQAFQAYF